MDGRGHRRGGVDAEELAGVERPDHADAGLADRHVDEVDQAVAGPACADLRAVVGGQPRLVPHLLVADEADADDEVARHAGPHRLEDAGPEAQAVVERAAVVVGAMVEQRRQELMDEVAVGGMDLDAVEARLGAVNGRGREGIDELVDLVDGEGLRWLLVLGDRGGGERGQLRPSAGDHAAVVRELHERQCVVPVDGVGDETEAGDAGGVPHVRVVGHLVGGRRMDRGLPGDDRADATGGAALEVPGEPRAVEAGLADDGRRVDEPGEVGTEDDPVLRRPRAESERLEQRRIGLGSPGTLGVVAHMPSSGRGA